jgi:hemerythrin superfamily protein
MFSLKNLSPTITDMIRFDHSHVNLTFHQYVTTKSASVKQALAETICDALAIHASLEEEIFYPVMREQDVGASFVDDSVSEHAEMRRLIAAIRNADARTAQYDDLVHELMRNVLHHVADEESVLLPAAERNLDARTLDALGVAMTKRRAALLAPKAGKVAINTVIGFSRSTVAMAVGMLAAGFALHRLTRKAA